MRSLNQMVGQHSFVRILDVFVDVLDLKQLNFKYTQRNQQNKKQEGRHPFNPADLLKLYLYGYQTGVRSCRKLEYACNTNIEMMWLLKGLTPHYRTIADFRKDNKTAFKKVFRQFATILKEWQLVEGKTIAIDSFKIRAQNALKNNYNQTKIDRQVKYIDDKIDEYLTELDKAEEEDKKHIQKQKYESLQKQLEQTGEKQISTTDADARAVFFKNISKSRI